MKVSQTRIAGVLLVEPRIFKDARGYFFESFHQARYADSSLAGPFVQDNVSFSQRHVLRGLHYQRPNPQGKLISVLQGEVFDVAVDLRKDSPTFRQWVGYRLSSENGWQLYVPEGFAHGFLTLSETALVHYKCTGLYDNTSEVCLRWDDPEIAVQWPCAKPILSAKDEAGLFLKAIPKEKLF